MKILRNILILILILILIIISIIYLVENFSFFTNEKATTITNIKNVLIVVGGFFASIIAVWRAFIADKNYKNETRKLFAQEEAFKHEKQKFKQQQINERYVKAVELIGSKSVSVRIGAMNTLEKISLEDEYYVSTLTEILTAYIKSELKSERLIEDYNNWKVKIKEWISSNKELNEKLNYKESYKSKPYRNIPEDIIVALNILTRNENKLIDLKNTDWEGFDFERTSIKIFNSFDFRNVSFKHTNFYGGGIEFNKCILENINFQYSIIGNTIFRDVYRFSANSEGKGGSYSGLSADFSYAYIDYTHIWTPISNCIFNKTKIRYAHIGEDKENNLMVYASNFIFKNSHIEKLKIDRQIKDFYINNVVFEETELFNNSKTSKNIFFDNIGMNYSNIFEKINNSNLPANIDEINSNDKHIIFMTKDTLKKLSYYIKEFNFKLIYIDNIIEKHYHSYPVNFKLIYDELKSKPNNFFGLLIKSE